jgi:hypothetical protein
MNIKTFIALACRTAERTVTDNKGRLEFVFDDAGLERFAEVVAAAEREACETIAEKELGNTAMLTSMPPQSIAVWNILAAIRARGAATK